MNENTDNALRVTAWANDMCRALNERNRFWKWLFRLSLGKYAYREYIGMIHMLNRAEYHPEFEYALEHAAYHNNLEWEYWSVKALLTRKRSN